MQNKSILSRWLPVLLWATVIFLASSNLDPYKPLPPRWIEPCFSTIPTSPSCAEYLGRLLHMTEYAILAFLSFRAAFWDNRKPRLLTIVAVLIFIELFALSDEIHQLFVPGRNFQLLDLGLDLLGVFLGLFLFSNFRNRKNRE